MEDKKSGFKGRNAEAMGIERISLKTKILDVPIGAFIGVLLILAVLVVILVKYFLF